MREDSVLLIEDNSDDEWFALWALKKIGITNITVARDGSEALILLHGDERQDIMTMVLPAIILLDLRLPKIDGLEVLRRIRSDERTKNCKVVVLTSSEDPHDKETCAALGVSAFMSKPLNENVIAGLNLFAGSHFRREPKE